MQDTKVNPSFCASIILTNPVYTSYNSVVNFRL